MALVMMRRRSRGSGRCEESDAGRLSRARRGYFCWLATESVTATVTELLLLRLRGTYFARKVITRRGCDSGEAELRLLQRPKITGACVK